MPTGILSATGLTRVAVPQPTLTYLGAGIKVSIPLSRLHLWCDLLLNLQATLTLIAGSNTVALAKKGDAWGCVTSIRLIENNSNVLCDINGNDLWEVNRAMTGVTPKISDTLGAGAANPILNETLILPLWMRRTVKPMDFAYEAYRAGDVRLEVTFDTYTKINSAATAYLANPQITVNMVGCNPSPSFIPQFVPRIDKYTQDYSGAQTAAKINLNANPSYCGWLFNCETQGGGADIADNLTNIKLLSGGNVLFSYSGSDILDGLGLSSGLPLGVEIATTGIPYQTNQRVSAENKRRAWYFLWYVSDGYATSAISTDNAGDLQFEVALAAACRFNIISFQFFRNRWAPVQQQAA